MMISMEQVKPASTVNWMRIGIFVIVWAVTAWLLMPLITLDKVDLHNSTEYFYRSAGGVVIMIILFGKTIVDLLFSQDLSRKKSILYVTFLTIYSIGLAGGIIFMCLRILLIYLNANASSYTGTTPGVQY